MASSARSISSTDLVRKSLSGKRFDVREWLFQALLLLSLLVALLFLIVLLGDVINKGIGILTDRGVNFLTDDLSTFAPSQAGVWQGILGSFGTLLFVAFISIPLGIGAAVYLEEYAPNTRFSRFINVNIRNLAGVPSIVYGLLGLALFVTLFNGITGGRSLISGGLTLAILVLPIVIITSAEALRAVPDSIREAGYGVGATKWEVIRHHVLPSAAPGILTGTILSLARALGETAPVLLVGAVTGYLSSSGGLLEQMQEKFTTLPTVIFAYAGLPNKEFREVTAAAILVLLLVILVANATAIMLRNRYERKW